MVDVLRKLLKIICELHELGRLLPAARRIIFPCCRQAVHSAATPTDRCHDTLPGADRVRCLWIARVCAGGGCYSESFVGSKIYASGRSPSTRWPARCPGDAQTRRSSFAAGAHGWLTVPSAHDLVLLCQQRPCSRTSSRMLERLRTAAPIRDPSVQLVSRFVLATCAHVKRCREHPRSGSSVRCSGTDFGDLPSSPQICPEGNRHCFEDTRPIPNFPARNIIFPASGCRDIHTSAPWEHSCVKGLSAVYNK